MSNVQDLIWCDARDEQGCLLYAPDCDQRDCFVDHGKKQETNTGSKAKLPDHYRCAITCALSGKRKHYGVECYQKQPLSAKLKTENASVQGSGKGNADKDSGKGKSKGNGKGQGGKGKGGQGGSERKPDKYQIANQSARNPDTTPVGNSGQTRDLRPVLRRKPNKNNGLSVPTKMGTSQTPANAPVSCAWRGNCRRRGSKSPAPRSSDRDAPGDLQIWCSGYLSLLGDMNTWGYRILGPLYLLWPRKLYLRGT